MSRPSLALLSGLVLTLACCRPSPPNPPTDPHPPEPVVQQDPIEGDPSDIEGEEIGEDHMDNAKIVEPGPADAAVGTRNALDTYPR